MNTTTDPLAEIQARLRRVERHNRILLTLCAGITGLVLFTAAENNRAEGEVKAHRFVLEDDKDKPTAYWASTNGYPILVFTGTNAVQRPEDSPVYLAGSPDGVVLYLNGPSPGPESTITLAAGGNSYFSMASPDRAIFEVSPTGATQISYKRVDNGELDDVFILQNSELGLYNLPLSFYAGQTNIVLELP
jgi:hypothetical protein